MSLFSNQVGVSHRVLAPLSIPPPAAPSMQRYVVNVIQLMTTVCGRVMDTYVNDNSMW